ncbi:MAG TPA: hypothetical protein VJ576_06580 [Rhodocyclaceae bacterium]|nr:hypothetical protein [Rhodocyclaceae bacterium]
MNQTDFAAACGQGKDSQIRYEADERSPDGNYFARAAVLGVDILYVITGQRMPGGLRQGLPAYSPAERLGEFIVGLMLSEEDAALLRGLVVRLANDPISRR